METEVRIALLYRWDRKRLVTEAKNKRPGTMRMEDSRRLYIHKNEPKLVTATGANDKKVLNFK